MKRFLKISRQETAFCAAFAIYIFLQVLSYSRYVDLLPDSLFLLSRLTVVLLLGAAFFFQGRLPLRELILDLFLTGFGIAAAFTSGQGFSLLLLLLFVLAGGSLDFSRILRLNRNVLLAGWVFVTLSCLAGVIENRTYPRPVLGVIAQTLGFNYYAYPTMILFTCSVIYLVEKAGKSPGCIWPPCWPSTSWQPSSTPPGSISGPSWLSRFMSCAPCKFSWITLKSHTFLFLAAGGTFCAFSPPLRSMAFTKNPIPCGQD